MREADPSTYVTEAHDNLDPFRLWDIMMANEKPGGHGERSVAVGVIEMAVWDALAEDLGRIESVLSLVSDGDCLAVDANGRFDLNTAIEYGDALAPYGLRWYEEPGDPLDYQLHADLATRYQGPIATGENLFSMQDMRNLLRHAGLRKDRDILQMDPVLSYGLVEYLRMLEVLGGKGWSRDRCIPHGGHQFALNIAAGLGLGGNESYPDVLPGKLMPRPGTRGRRPNSQTVQASSASCSRRSAPGSAG